MESFFGIGGPELLLILILATVILGPLRMIQAARTLGRLARDLRNYYTELTRGLDAELSALNDLKESVHSDVTSAIPTRDELQILPPTLSTGTSPASDPTPPAQTVSSAGAPSGAAEGDSL